MRESRIFNTGQRIIIKRAPLKVWPKYKNIVINMVENSGRNIDKQRIRLREIIESAGYSEFFRTVQKGSKFIDEKKAAWEDVAIKFNSSAEAGKAKNVEQISKTFSIGF